MPMLTVRKPESECTRQCRATMTSKPTASKPMVKVGESRTAVVEARSPTTSKPTSRSLYEEKFERMLYDKHKGNGSRGQTTMRYDRGTVK